MFKIYQTNRNKKSIKSCFLYLQGISQSSTCNFLFFSRFFHHFVCFRRMANQFQAYFYEPTVQHGSQTLHAPRGTGGCYAGRRSSFILFFKRAQRATPATPPRPVRDTELAMCQTLISFAKMEQPKESSQGAHAERNFEEEGEFMKISMVKQNYQR